MTGSGQGVLSGAAVHGALPLAQPLALSLALNPVPSLDLDLCPNPEYPALPICSTQQPSG